MMFLLGRQAMFGHEPPTYWRSTTTTRCPFCAEVQAISLPPMPLPSTRRSYSSVEVNVFIVLQVVSFEVVSVLEFFQRLKDIIRIKAGRVIDIHVGETAPIAPEVEVAIRTPAAAIENSHHMPFTKQRVHWTRPA